MCASVSVSHHPLYNPSLLPALQGQFPALVIGSVHVTDNDDHDRQDKTFQMERSNDLEAAAHFTVDLYTGDITMLRGTPAGTHTLKVTVSVSTSTWE